MPGAVTAAHLLYNAAMHDPRAKHALYMAKSPAKSSLSRGSVRALAFIVGSAVILGGLIWMIWTMR